MKWKIIILTILITAVVTLGIVYFIIYKSLQGFREKCKLVKTDLIKNYKIEQSECLGWAGPPYISYDLYEDGKRLSSGLLKKDSCEFYFSQGDDKLLLLNLCDQSVHVRNPEKRNLQITEIDSVIITKMSNLNRKKLNPEEVLEFTIRWNNSTPDGAINPEHEYYPEPKYFIEVFTKNEIRIFKTSHITIQEKGSFWEFNILDKDEERTTQKFDKVFNMNE